MTAAPFLNLKKGYNEAMGKKIEKELEKETDPYRRNKLMERQYLQDIYGGIGTIYTKYNNPY